MYSHQTLIDHCLTYADAAADRPFDDFNTVVLRHKSNRKWFALLLELDGRLCVNVKCDPAEADFLRRAYTGVTPAWHMNKVHWNTVEVNSDVPDGALRGMIEQSFRLTAPKRLRSAAVEKQNSP